MAARLAGTLDVELVKPRICGRQCYRDNAAVATSEQYFRQTLWYPYIDSLVAHLMSKFDKNNSVVLSMDCLIPARVGNLQWETLKDAVDFYAPLLSSVSEIKEEIKRWKEYAKRSDASDALSALAIVPPYLPNVKMLMQILCTLPISTCSAERSFSSLKYLKNYLRNRMNDDRLTGLALLYLHHEITVNVDDVINIFAKKNRKREFVL